MYCSIIDAVATLVLSLDCPGLPTRATCMPPSAPLRILCHIYRKISLFYRINFCIGSTITTLLATALARGSRHGIPPPMMIKPFTQQSHEMRECPWNMSSEAIFRFLFHSPHRVSMRVWFIRRCMRFEYLHDPNALILLATLSCLNRGNWMALVPAVPGIVRAHWPEQ